MARRSAPKAVKTIASRAVAACATGYATTLPTARTCVAAPGDIDGRGTPAQRFANQRITRRLAGLVKLLHR